jgi:beta-lactamase regulating signal transducer with metallopeptidase domain
MIAPLSLLWLRAAIRAVRALGPVRPLPPAATIGLWQPRAFVSPALQTVLDEAALAAVWAHERAHIRRRDPLRIWIAQLLTDLQWPSPRARLRLSRWLEALELACDEAARRDGVDGADLAAGIVAAARLTPSGGAIVAGAYRSSAGLALRIQRLLLPMHAAEPPRERHWRLVAVPALLVAALALGAWRGEWVVRALLRLSA